MACYRSGGCGPYEMRSCSECPASKPEYAVSSSPEYALLKKLREDARKLETEIKVARDEFEKNHQKSTSEAIIKVKAFLDEKGVVCVLTNSQLPIEIEIINTVSTNGENSNESDDVDAYINQLCGDGFIYVNENNIQVVKMPYSESEDNV